MAPHISLLNTLLTGPGLDSETVYQTTEVIHLLITNLHMRSLGPFRRKKKTLDTKTQAGNSKPLICALCCVVIAKAQ